MTPGLPLGLPSAIEACLFDLDGVLTDTRALHAEAWREVLDDVLRVARDEPFAPFDQHADYDAYVDGKLRADGVRSFLASRGLTLPEGDPDDPPAERTVNGIGNRKNLLVLERLHAGGVRALPGAAAYVGAVRRAGLSTAVVTSSENCGAMLASAGLEGLFDVRVDSGVALREALRGKPAPDTYLAAARLLHASPLRTAVFEDSLAGVEAGRNGAFGWVVGIAPPAKEAQFRAHGASVVVAGLAELAA